MPLPPLDTTGLPLIVRLRARLIEKLVARRNARAEATLMAMPWFAEAITEYAKKSNVTGASMSDYLTLYEKSAAANRSKCWSSAPASPPWSWPMR
jgi:hypothetical protein